MQKLALPALALSIVLLAAGPVQVALTVAGGFVLSDAGHIPKARELAVAPNGDLFVGTSERDVYIIAHPDTTPAAPHVFVTMREGPANGVAFGPDALYVGTQFRIWRIPYKAGDEKASAPPEPIAAVRTSNEQSDHVTTTLAFANGTLYASVGSSCDACDPELDATRATIQAMRPDGKDMHPAAIRVRNAVALAVNPNTGAVWFGEAGQDYLQPGHPYERVDAFTLHSGTPNYGWPHCVENRIPVDKHDCSEVPIPRVVLPAYVTPIGMAIYPQNPNGAHAFPEKYRGGLFIGTHGSWHRPLRPPRVVFVPLHGDEPEVPVDWKDPNKQWTLFVGGFQNADESRTGRATGVAVGKEGDLYVADDYRGAVYRIRYQ